jgi:hypothetical protein
MGSPRFAARLLPMIARDCAIRPLPQAFTHHATLVCQHRRDEIEFSFLKSNLMGDGGPTAYVQVKRG